MASGHSLTQADVDYCRGKGRVIVVNDGYKLAPWADVLYAADTDWWEYHVDALNFKGEKWTVSYEIEKKYGINRIDFKPSEKWSHEKDWIATGGNSGFQVVNLADLWGAKKIILVGYDMGYTNKKHWFGEHPAKINRPSRYDEWIKKFEQAKPLIKAKVINCTPNSNLKCFEMANLRDVL